MTRKLSQCAQDLLAVVEYRGTGNAKTAYMIENEIKEKLGRQHTVDEYTKALGELSQDNAGNGEDFLLERNGWFFKMTMKRLNLSRDDVEWLLGGGYYAQ